MAVKKFWKVIFGSCSNCKLVDVKNRSHDSPGAWKRFILDSQTTTSMSLGQKGGYKSMSKPWDNSSISHPSPIHLPFIIIHAHSFTIQKFIHHPLAKTSILKKESKVQIHRMRRSAKQQEGSNLETRVYSFLSLCLLRFYFNHVC